MSAVVVVAAGIVARKVFDLLADQVGQLLRDKWIRDPAEIAFEQALSAAVERYSADSDRRSRLAEPLLGKRGVLVEDAVVEEIAHILRFDRAPDAAVIGDRWRQATRGSGVDFEAEAVALLDYLRGELRGSEPFRAVFDAKALDQIATVLSATEASSTERAAIMRLINFLEDRRVLYDWSTGHSVAAHFVLVGMDRSACLSPAAVASIREIRTRIGVAVNEVPRSSASARALKRMQATCRWALDVAEQDQGRVVRDDADNEELWGMGVLEYGMTFLGLFRKKLGFDIGVLSEMHDIEIEGPLRDILEMEALFAPSARRAAEQLVPTYMKKHGGFRDMGPGWYEELCAQASAVQRPWRGNAPPRRRHPT